MRRIIGLTGGIASGKSTVSVRLLELGAKIVDADEISRNILVPGTEAYKKVMETFPAAVTKEEIIDRKLLGGIVFSDEVELKKLNLIMHPEIVKVVKNAVNELSGVVIVDAPLLIEVGLNTICDEIWVVTADVDVRIERMAKRNGFTEEEARKRIDSQLGDDEKLRLADRVIDNSKDIEWLITQVDSFYEDVLRSRG